MSKNGAKIGRAYSIINVKRANDDARVIEGIASTPTPDRMGDIVEPDGAEFSVPMPLLWQHNSSQPVGHVTWAKVAKDGIAFRAKIFQIEEPLGLRNRLEEAWQSVKSGLVRGVSIGFRSLSHEFMASGGIRFAEWEWMELSLVTIPANSEATINTIKSLDQNFRRAALGQQRITIISPRSGQPVKSGDPVMKTFKEKIAELEKEIGPKRARMEAIMKAALEDDDRELSAEEQEEFDELTGEVKEAQAKLDRLKQIDGSAVTAKAVAGDTSVRGSQARATVPAEPKVKLEKGIGFARMVMCFAAAKGSRLEALDIAKQKFPHDERIQAFLKAQVPGATTAEPGWAGYLAEPENLASEFVEFLRPMTIVGKFGANGIPALRRVPFNIKVPAEISQGTGAWVGQGNAIPLIRSTFDQIVLRFTKVAAISVLSEELIRFSSPSAEMLVRQSLAEACVGRLDSDFANPSITETTDVRPGAVTNGATTSAASGIDAAAVRADIRTAIAYFITNNIPTAGLVVLMRSSQALSLSLMRNNLGAKEFPDMTMNGGLLEGIPVIASQYMPQGVVAFVSADNVYLADDGGVNVDMSREASIEMATDPTNKITDGASPPVSVEATMVSMFQTNSVAIRAIREITWKRRRAAAVYYFTATGWGNADTSPPQASI